MMPMVRSVGMFGEGELLSAHAFNIIMSDRTESTISFFIQLRIINEFKSVSERIV